MFIRAFGGIVIAAVIASLLGFPMSGWYGIMGVAAGSYFLLKVIVSLDGGTQAKPKRPATRMTPRLQKKQPRPAKR